MPAMPVSAATGAAAGPAPGIETDALVIGAGPVGLFQVFQLGLLEIKAQIVDSLPHPGGQCVELYADKPIYDIPAVPVCSGRELAERLLAQIKPFGAGFHLGQQLSTLQRRADGRFDLATDKGRRFIAKTVFVAGGVGSFQPRRLNVDGIERFEASQLLYQVDDAQALAGRHIVIAGDDDAALDWAAHFAQAGPQRAAAVTLVHRRDVFRASVERIARMRALCDAKLMRLLVGQISGFESDGVRLRALQIRSHQGTEHVPADVVLALLGLSPKLGPIADWGLALARKQVVVDTEKFETSVPGVFAVGDINTYPGKRKLIVCGFHEATLAAYAAAHYVFPDKPIQLQYTTTSPRLHQLLGLAPPAAD